MIKMSLADQLKSLQGYLEHLDNKFTPDWSIPTNPKFTKTQIKMANKEMNRVGKRIRELSCCSRHTGKHGLDCYVCKLEGMF